MAAVFVHLSDIHFGQEKGSQVIVQDDVKARLLDDLRDFLPTISPDGAKGIIVTGDIAYAGKRSEYVRAAQWLDNIAAIVKCEKTDVQVVPGNHDIDHAAISSGCEFMLAQIAEIGEAKLDAYLASELDREVLYGRFADYRPFAEGYNCTLDMQGGFASVKRLELAPGKSLRFIGLNSALACAKKDKPGELLLGKRQTVLPREDGVELVVLGHHPLHWLRDSDDARRYVRSRARVFISGHEHDPSLKIENIDEGCDLLTIAAGATVPPTETDHYTYTYNLLAFSWDETADGLRVDVYPRAWCRDKTAFGPDDVRLGGRLRSITLGSPNFRKSGTVSAVERPLDENTMQPASISEPAEEADMTVATAGGDVVSDQFALTLLVFFRDLSAAQRLRVLVSMNALPDNFNERLSLSMERHIVEMLNRSGRLAELNHTIDTVTRSKQNKSGGNDG